jgi:hypothetical protein
MVFVSGSYQNYQHGDVSKSADGEGGRGEKCEGPVRIQYKCLVVPIYVFAERKLRSLFISKTEL